MIPLKILAYLRNHWLLILLIVIGLLWWRILGFIFPEPRLPYWEDPYQTFDYWSMISHPEIIWIALVGFIAIWIFILIRMWRIESIAHRPILIIATLLICVISTCTPMILNTDDSQTMTHVMSVSYQGKLYQLAFYKSVRFMNTGSSSFYVFECDLSANRCSKIYMEVAGAPDQAKLVVAEDKLIYQYDTKNRVLLPRMC